MENKTDATAVAESEAQRKELERSAAYPIFGIDKTDPFVLQLHTSYGKSVIKREDAEAVNQFGYTNRFLAAGCQYGLLSRDKDGYRITDLFISIHKPINENERRTALIEAFSSPKLYRALIDNYDGHAIPTELSTVLFRKHDIAEKASDSAAKVFIENGKYVGVIDEQNILRVSQSKTKLGNTQFAEVITEDLNKETSVTSQATVIPEQFRLPPPPEEGFQTEIINLRNTKKASLIFPSDISKKDITIIRKRLDEIEFRIEEGPE